MPIPLVAGALSPILMQVLRWLFLAKLASFIGRLFVGLGIGLATHEFVIEPFLTGAEGAWLSLPPEVGQWISAFGVDVAVSILLSAEAIAATKDLVLQKR